ncbi:helix-turn-helix domain-containing protein [Arcobacter arenosus]|uniref:Helix-turn-helix domain-containing protein n=1 Tax=Arcobacter arenosus TaxID=2576037 RepID=A0A5R8Y4R2_9BACT|nr:helix-turn-helix domain-containing protein [Arcobacter arenosus]TLP41056.1 helix-turn-helix domain-containing protein [Arcobacter arenosus]
MSIKVMEKVFRDETLDPNKKLIMLALADNANDEGYCYPSINTIVLKTSLSKPTVIKHMKELEGKSLLLSKKRSRKNGSSTTKIYIVYPLENLQNLDEEIKEKFEQSKEALPHHQSKEALPPRGGQSKEALPLEPSPSLFNHHLFSKLSKSEKDLYLEYSALRKKMKLQTTLKIHDRLLQKYFDFGRNEEIIKRAIASNWKDFYQVKQQNNQLSKREQSDKFIDDYFANMQNQDVQDCEVIYEC